MVAAEDALAEKGLHGPENARALDSIVAQPEEALAQAELDESEKAVASDVSVAKEAVSELDDSGTATTSDVAPTEEAAAETDHFDSESAL